MIFFKKQKNYYFQCCQLKKGRKRLFSTNLNSKLETNSSLVSQTNNAVWTRSVTLKNVPTDLKVTFNFQSSSKNSVYFKAMFRRVSTRI